MRCGWEVTCVPDIMFYFELFCYLAVSGVILLYGGLPTRCPAVQVEGRDGSDEQQSEISREYDFASSSYFRIGTE
jgi:hypothetical protein